MKTGSNLIEEVVLWLRVEKIEENQPDYRTCQGLKVLGCHLALFSCRHQHKNWCRKTYLLVRPYALWTGKC